MNHKPRPDAGDLADWTAAELAAHLGVALAQLDLAAPADRCRWLRRIDAIHAELARRYGA
jgi:hypothetical protein